MTTKGEPFNCKICSNAGTNSVPGEDGKLGGTEGRNKWHESLMVDDSNVNCGNKTRGSPRVNMVTISLLHMFIALSIQLSNVLFLWLVACTQGDL